MASQPTNAGIITDAAGVRHIPESTRADGSTRRAIRIRPGYQPPEDVALYRNRTAENFRNRMKGVVGAEPAATTGRPSEAPAASGAATVATGTKTTVPGAVPGAAPGTAPPTPSDASNKNAKRREARKKAAETRATSETADKADKTDKTDNTDKSAAAAAPVEDPAAEREKKARGLKKKLKQARELKTKRDDGEALLPEQIAKVVRINELIRELDVLGFDAEGEPKTEGKT